MPDRGHDAAVTEVLALEAARCRAISGQDWEALAAMLSDDLTHTHITGVTQDKATYLAHVQKNPRRVERRALKVRIYGDVAVVTGPQVNLVEADAGPADAAGEGGTRPTPPSMSSMSLSSRSACEARHASIDWADCRTIAGSSISVRQVGSVARSKQRHSPLPNWT